jgi:hypothetical protein
MVVALGMDEKSSATISRSIFANRNRGGLTMGRIVLGGLLAGVVVFFWGAIAHMALPIGKIGIQQIPNEEAMLAAFRGSITAPGFYFFPWMDLSATSSKSEHEAAHAKYNQGPTGILVIHPEGGDPMTPRQLGTELATNVVSALVAAFLLAHVASSYARRVLFVTFLGLFGFLIANVPDWNWYGFPTDFTLAQATEHIVGWFLAGLVLAAIVRPLTPRPV